MIKKVVIWGGVGIGAIVGIVVGVAVYYDVPRFVVGLARYGGQAREGTLQVGDAAPIVPLHPLDGGAPRPLASYLGDRPLVLIFGSFT